MRNNIIKTELSFGLRILVLAILLSTVVFQIEVVGQSYNGILITKRAAHDSLSVPEKFEFSIGDIKYLVMPNGDCIKVDRGGKSWNFRLPLDDKFHIERVDYVDREGDLIIIYEVTDYDVGAGKVIRIDKAILKKKWLAHVPGFNIGEALMKHHYLYLSAIGFVGKLDLDSGKYVWRHEDLYNKGPGIFNSFERPVIEKDLIKFTERLPYISKGSPVTIVINDHTGKILSPRF